MREVKILNRTIGEGHPCFIMAEAGVNHNGDLTLAKSLIDVAKKAGADAVKFQTFNAESMVAKDAPKAEYQRRTTGKGGSQYEMVKKLELTSEDFQELSDYSKQMNILFVSSPFDEQSVDILEKLGVQLFKVPSGEMTNLALLKYIAKKGKPTILSTGMCNLREIEEAVHVIRSEGLHDIILLQCTSEYPAKVEDANLKVMATLKRGFKVPVGFSDHTPGITVPIAAAALGACVIEKHFTLDRHLAGPDHKSSLEPRELKEMVKAIREVEKAMGNGVKKTTKEEEKNKKAVRKSIVAKVDISKGKTITEDMLTAKRPGFGMEPKNMHKIIGTKARINIKKDALITPEIISGC